MINSTGLECDVYAVHFK